MKTLTNICGYEIEAVIPNSQAHRDYIIENLDEDREIRELRMRAIKSLSGVLVAGVIMSSAIHTATNSHNFALQVFSTALALTAVGVGLMTAVKGCQAFNEASRFKREILKNRPVLTSYYRIG